jgi:hypothetical protein
MKKSPFQTIPLRAKTADGLEEENIIPIELAKLLRLDCFY